ncbi:MAG TPA: hypothetical protein VKZ66_00360 [Pusillimonas sp.]|uniref:hypothetical protein n=1 Tax=unclassified Pusillimonas TaxID=2640016 RepID=UPI0026193DAF|nr:MULTISPECIES: hypothetical protein [unclassified Pusillimonas]HLU18384.1 hypothetical protein [Pusillimonas sp.]
MNSPQTPAKWPFPPVQQPRRSRSGKVGSSSSTKKSLSRGAMLADVCLVAIWGATIPGLMWLGSAGGF